jgi:hypothetical protein
MSRFRVRCYENGEVRWIELAGAAAATPADTVRREVRAAFLPEGEGPARRYVLDLSQVLAVGGRTLEAIIGAIPPDREVGLIPPPQPGWFEEVGGPLDVSVTVYASERHALLALGLESRGEPCESAIDKRRHLRIPTSLRSRLWLHSPRGERFGKAIVSNLSKSGAYLTQLDCELGAEEFRYFATGGGPLVLALPIVPERRHIRSRVVRLDTVRGVPNLGVSFEEIDPELERALAAYVAERAGDAETV